jgi:hypothetical protein
MDTAAIKALDEWVVYLRRKRLAKVTRSDVIRMALLRLPRPTDAHHELSSAITDLTARYDPPQDHP